MVRISDLKNRDVVCVNDGKRLGFISDLVFDVDRGTVKAIVIPQSAGFCLLGRGKNEHIIPWEKIVRVGVDIILVDHTSDFTR